MHKKTIGDRFIVASKNQSTKPLMWFLKFSKWFLIMLKVFIEKIYFTHALKSFEL